MPWAVYFFARVYNPNVMPLFGTGMSLALWTEVQRERARSIIGVAPILFIMPQFHMSGLMLIPAALLILWLSPTRLNLPWLAAGVLAGLCAYIPYFRGEMAHGWQNTAGMFTGGVHHTWDALKAIIAPFNFLVSWSPRWTRSAGEYRAMGRACFGWFGVFLAFNILSAVVAGFLTAGAFLRLKTASRGLFQSPCAAFARSPGILFLAIMAIVPLIAYLLAWRSFNSRYYLAMLPAFFALTAHGAVQWLAVPRFARGFKAALILRIAAWI